MEATDKNQQREEIFAKVVRAGKRTYFFDVKETRAKEKYLTITESKRRFNNDTQKFFYEKHKLFLYKEDFDKFADALELVIHFIRTGELPPEELEEVAEAVIPENPENEISDISFEDLGEDTENQEKEEDKE